ncbi:MAG: hypothetical protein AB8U93_01525 [Francisella endosymbiont of Hyalomma scupense]
MKTAMNKTLKQFSSIDSQNFEDIEAFIVFVKEARFISKVVL